MFLGKGQKLDGASLPTSLMVQKEKRDKKIQGRIFRGSVSNNNVCSILAPKFNMKALSRALYRTGATCAPEDDERKL